MEPIEKGTQIEVTDALGRRFSKRALTGINRGGDFESVWACSEEEWSAAEAEGVTLSLSYSLGRFGRSGFSRSLDGAEGLS